MAGIYPNTVTGTTGASANLDGTSPRKYSAQETIQIYTDWANHYLEKSRSKKHIQDLQVDVTDGVILADVVEAVTNQKVPDLIRKPKNSSQMLENIQSCLTYLTGLGVTLDGINSREIRDGHLKSILSLFFQLSRFKQQQKQVDRDRHHRNNMPMPSNKRHDGSNGGGGNVQQGGGGLCVQDNNGGGGGLNLVGPIGSQQQQQSASSRLPSLFGKHVHGGGPNTTSNSSIPTPGSIIPTSGAGQPSSTGTSSLRKKAATGSDRKSSHNLICPGNTGNLKPASGGSSRSTSPMSSGIAAVNGSVPHSFIPTPRSTTPSSNLARSSLHEKHINNAKLLPSNSIQSSGTVGTGAINKKSSSSSSARAAYQNNHTNNNNNNINSHLQQHGTIPNTNNHNSSSMLEKFRFFKDKDKSDKIKSGSKRTSSSSGFSSARSERSDSSVGSLCNETHKSVTPVSSSSSVVGGIIVEGSISRGSSGTSTASSSSTTSSSCSSHPHVNVNVNVVNNTPPLHTNKTTTTQSQSSFDSLTSQSSKSGIRSFRQRLGKAISNSANSANSTNSNSRKDAVAKVTGEEYLKKVPTKAAATTATATIESSRDHQCQGQGNNGISVNVPVTNNTKLRVPNRTIDSTAELPSNNSNEIIRRPKTNLTQAVGAPGQIPATASKNRYSGTGIPSRNSALISNYNNNNSREQLTDNNSGGSNLNLASGIGTGIPKPTAAVKGTTKPVTSSSATHVSTKVVPVSSVPIITNSNGDLDPKQTAGTVNNVKVNNTNSAAVTLLNANGSKTVSPVPPSTATVALDCCDEFLEEKEDDKLDEENQQQESLSFCDYNTVKNESPLSSSSGISIAMVSPMPPPTTLNSKYISSSIDSALSQSSLENSVIMVGGLGIGSGESEGCSDKHEPITTSTAAGIEPHAAAQRLPPTLPPKGAAAQPMPPPPKSLPSVKCSPHNSDCLTNFGTKNKRSSNDDAIIECDEIDDVLLNVTPMEPLENIRRSSPLYGGYMMKSPPPPLQQQQPATVQGNHLYCTNSIGRSSQTTASSNKYNITNNCQYSRYNHHVTPIQMSNTAGDYDYPDMDNLDLHSAVGAGYLSDGDLLFSGSNGLRASNVNNDGYLSESSASVYYSPSSNRRLQSTGAATTTSGTGVGVGSVGGRSVNNRGRDRRFIHDERYFERGIPTTEKEEQQEKNCAGINNSNNRNNNKHANPSSDVPTATAAETNNSYKKNGRRRRFDDSSSLSSGISDLNEIPTDLTSSELSSPYASLQRTNESNNKKKNSNIIYRVIGYKSNKDKQRDKSDNSTTTENNTTVKVPTNGKEDNDEDGDQYNVSSQQHGHSSGRIGRRHEAQLNGKEPRHQSNDSSSSPESPGNYNSLTSKQQQINCDSQQQQQQFRNYKEDMDKKRGMKEDYYAEISENYRYNGNYEPTGRNSGSNGSSSNNKGHHHNNTASSSNNASNNGLPVSYGYIRGPMTKYNVVNGKLQHEATAAAAATNVLCPLSPKTRTKVKVSGGTQTTNDLHEINRHHQQHHHGVSMSIAAGSGGGSLQRPPQHHYGHHNSTGDVVEYASSTASGNSTSGVTAAGLKSLSLTSPTAAQLSQSLRERILGSQSLPKGATTSADYAAILATIQKQQQLASVYGTPNASKERMSRYHKAAAAAGVSGSGVAGHLNDGSLSDTGYTSYGEIMGYGHPQGQSHSHGHSGGNIQNHGHGHAGYSWGRHSGGYASSVTSAPTRLAGGGSMTEGESLESLSSTCSSTAAVAAAAAAQALQYELRSNSLSHRNQQHKENNNSSPNRSPRLNRSNSIRSTKSEKVYPSMLQRNEDLSPYSTTQVSSGGGGGGLSSSPSRHRQQQQQLQQQQSLDGKGQGSYTNNQNAVRLSMSPYSGFLAKVAANKEDEINGSSLSLVSTASSIYSSQEDRQAYQVRKLRRELQEAQEKVQTLTNQLSTNAHVVAAFEQSLSNMTHRLQSLTLTAEQKDSELIELRHTIELLRKQSIEAGLTVANFQSISSRDGSPIARQLSADSVSSINSISSACSGTSHSHSHTSSPSGKIHLNTITTNTTTTPLGNTPTNNYGISNADHSPTHGNKKQHGTKNKGWLRSSFTKAFSRSKIKSRNIHHNNYNNTNNDSICDENQLLQLQHQQNDQQQQLLTANTRPLNLNGVIYNNQNGSDYNNCQYLVKKHHSQHNNDSGSSCGQLSPSPRSNCNGSGNLYYGLCSHSPNCNSNGILKGSNSTSGLCDDLDDKHKSVDDLKKQLREKEMVLTDIRLEALTSAHQLESLKETVNKMRNEMLSLKQDNDRLQRLVTSKSLTSSQSSLQQQNDIDAFDRRLSATEITNNSAAASIDILLADPTEKAGKHIILTVFLGCHGSYERYLNSSSTSIVENIPSAECSIGVISVNNHTKWDLLDSLVKRTFKDYLTKIDPTTNLGLSTDSILCYCIGEIVRFKDNSMMQLPELLPCGYLVGDINKIRICLKGASTNGSIDALAFETLISKTILTRYLTWLQEYGRLMLCGPSGIGKSYLARKLGEFIVAKENIERGGGIGKVEEGIATFSCSDQHNNNQKNNNYNNKELKQYLTNLAEQCENSTAIEDLPSVIILDNLHQIIPAVFDEISNIKFMQHTTKENGENSSSAANCRRLMPLIIGTMSQSSTTTPTNATATNNLQMHSNFKWVLLRNHAEPVKGLLSRYLQRRLIESDIQNGTKNLELGNIMEWIPEVWLHINKFLEKYSSSDVTIGPRLLLSCPTDVANSQVWFKDLWHYSIVPYLIDAVKEGLTIYGKKNLTWEDPTLFLLQTYPWNNSNETTAMGTLPTNKSSLLRIRPEDVGYDSKSGSCIVTNKTTKCDGTDGDPLMNMLMRLQEAANYSGTHSNESDSNSLDSHASIDSKEFTTAA